MNNWLEIAQDWLLPRQCALCAGDAGNSALCRRCVARLPRITNACRGCGLPLPHGRLCGGCVGRHRPFRSVRIPFRYEPPLSALILALKFDARLEVAAPLAGLLLAELERSSGALPALVVPVPLHPARVRRRGYNQALEIARPLAAALGIGLAPHLVYRQRNTTAQSGLPNPAARRRNVRGAFAVSVDAAAAPPQSVALVDDVVTTGATVRELARVLTRAGVARIDLWFVARAAPP
ncbi:MAG: ComF family protein [Gammaproteobacteria bacterium]|nr:ComF family protein [Gammaproteobacteria bacterium]